MPEHLNFEDELVINLAMDIAEAQTRTDAARVVWAFRAAVRESIADAYSRRQLRAAARLAAIYWRQYRQRLQ